MIFRVAETRVLYLDAYARVGDPQRDLVAEAYFAETRRADNSGLCDYDLTREDILYIGAHTIAWVRSGRLFRLPWHRVLAFEDKIVRDEPSPVTITYNDKPTTEFQRVAAFIDTSNRKGRRV